MGYLFDFPELDGSGGARLAAEGPVARARTRDRMTTSRRANRPQRSPAPGAGGAGAAALPHQSVTPKAED